ncbi:MAG: formate dehydrogenase gamma subunit [Acidimicrobiaceae bacterium]|nr:formate dehydrogenase gamma subunit [Acidimicrobiaceae bacterium]
MTNASIEQRRRRSRAEWRMSTRHVIRFDRVERVAHWANAVLFGILMATALPLYFVQVENLVGRRALIAEIHLWSGVALPIPLIISLAGPWGARLRRDVRRINIWTAAEIRWLWSLGRKQLREADKFNPGQKLNALFTAGAIVVMLGTGSILKWFRFFPVSWRTGATFVHDVFAATVFVVVFGHVGFALTHRDALRSMFKGWVTEAWANRHAKAWLRELKVEKGVPTTPDSTATG